MMIPLASLADIYTAIVFRDRPPQEDSSGNVRSLAIRNLTSGGPLQWDELPRVTVEEKHLAHCLQRGDVVIPSRGDHYKAWLFPGANEPVLPVGQLNVIRPRAPLSAAYLAWYLNLKTTQARLALLSTGTSIKAVTKASLASLEIETLNLQQQHRIAELDQLAARIASIRSRLSELDRLEVGAITNHLLQGGGADA
jgi:restriction endonuclease S subunit